MNKDELLELFDAIGLREAAEIAFGDECRNAYLHGLVDGAFEQRVCPFELYYQIKVAIAALGDDGFAESWRRRTGQELSEKVYLGEIEQG